MTLGVKQRHALAVIAATGSDGATETLLTAHGFSIRTIALPLVPPVQRGQPVQREQQGPSERRVHKAQQAQLEPRARPGQQAQLEPRESDCKGLLERPARQVRQVRNNVPTPVLAILSSLSASRRPVSRRTFRLTPRIHPPPQTQPLGMRAYRTWTP